MWDEIVVQKKPLGALRRAVPADDGVFIGSTANGGMDKPTFLTFDKQGVLYISDLASNSVLRLAANCTLPGSFGETGSSGPNVPLGVRFSSLDGSLHVASFKTDTIVRFDGITRALLDIVVDGSAGATGGLPF